MNELDFAVRYDFCCSCGLCVAVCPRHQLEMVETGYGELRPRASGRCAESCRLCALVCPFGNEHGHDEDTLGRLRFAGDANCTHDPVLGWVRDTFVGGLANESERLKAPSGGLATALLQRLLGEGEIDAALVIEPLSARPWHHFRIAETAEQVLESRGSVYHVTSMDRVIADVLAGAERSYAVVALPCAAKAIRLAQERLPALRRRIRYILGLTCSGYRSLQLTDLVTALLGRRRGVLRYRSKTAARSGLDFRIEVESEATTRSLKMLGLFGFLWINEVGRLKSCLHCDDVFAELADATFMDAWLPEYKPDRRGTSLVISRNERLSLALAELFETGACEGGPIAPARIAESQQGVVNRRRVGLAALCELAQETHGYAPKKRLHLAASGDGLRGRAEAIRELAYHRDIREALRRFAERSCGKSARVARFQAWRTCGTVLRIAARHGALTRTLAASKFLRFRLGRGGG